MIKRFVGTSDFPYAVEFEAQQGNVKEICDWCEEQFGKPCNPHADNNAECKWINAIFGVRFRKEEHQHWFLMRWS